MIEKYIHEKSGESVLEQILTYLSNIKDERELAIIYNGLMLYWLYKRNNFFSLISFSLIQSFLLYSQ